MFGWSTTKRQKLEARYKKLRDESCRLSHQHRQQSDLKAAEADEVR